MSSMKAAAILGQRHAEVIDMPRQAPKRNEIEVRVDLCGICTWDQRVFVGEKKMPLPLVGGHEIVGRIATLGEDVDPKAYPIGKQVAVKVVRSCHSCYYCRHDMSNMCVELNTLNLDGPDVWGMGGFAQYITADRSSIFDVDETVKAEEAVLIEPIACVVNSFSKGRPRLGDDIVVIGGGPMGLIHVMIGKASGCRVIISEPNQQRREVAKGLGAAVTLDPTQCDLGTEIKKITAGRGAEVVFNTTPIASLAEQAIGLAAPNGRVVMYSSMHPDKPISVSPGMLHGTQIELTGAVSPSIESFDTAVTLVNKGIINPSILLSRVFSYLDCQKAFEAAIDPSTFRVAMKFD